MIIVRLMTLNLLRQNFYLFDRIILHRLHNIVIYKLVFIYFFYLFVMPNVRAKYTVWGELHVATNIKRTDYKNEYDNERKDPCDTEYNMRKT